MTTGIRLVASSPLAAEALLHEMARSAALYFRSATPRLPAWLAGLQVVLSLQAVGALLRKMTPFNLQ